MKDFRYNNVNIKWLGHASFRLEHMKIIYIDPFRLQESKHDADIILISHEHFDHFSPEDINKIIKEDTMIIVPPDCLSKMSRFVEKGKTVTVRPGDKIKISGSLTVEAVPAYNISKFRAPGIPFHPKENDWLGYILEIDGKKIYFAGDTDFIPELRSIKADLMMVPVSGTYVMTASEAAEFVTAVKPEIAIPMHYGEIVGSEADAEKFKSLVRVSVVVLERS
ncbi:MBL fold metallo-hydrolase [Candidatus Woesearchaeota archaeon]|nr:MBL fold metallo-hydrolase [Candidatus Woesearchaeota archaeon]